MIFEEKLESCRSTFTWMLRAERFSTTPLTLEDSTNSTPSAVTQITTGVLTELRHLNLLAGWTREDIRPFEKKVAPSDQLLSYGPYQMNEGQQPEFAHGEPELPEKLVRPVLPVTRRAGITSSLILRHSGKQRLQHFCHTRLQPGRSPLITA